MNNDPYRVLVEGRNIRPEDLVAGNTLSFSYRVSARVAERCGVPCRGTIKVVVKSAKPNKIFPREVTDLHVFVEKLGLIWDGGFTIASQKGWLHGSSFPRELMH